MKSIVLRRVIPSLVAVCSWVGVLAAVPVARADAPGLIPVQGFLTDDAGVPIDKAVRLTFLLYDAETEGTQVGSDDYASIDVDRGHFVVYLGSQNSSNIDLATFRDHGDVWLETVIGGTETVTPRTRLGSMAFAAYAQYCGDAATFAGESVESFVGTAGDSTIAGGVTMENLTVSGHGLFGTTTSADAPSEPVETGGSLSGVRMADRMEGQPIWVAYPSGGSFRVWNQTNSDVMSVTSSGVLSLKAVSTFNPANVPAGQMQLGHVSAVNGWDATGFCAQQGGNTMCSATNGGAFYWGYQTSPTVMETKMYLVGSTGNLIVSGSVSQASSQERKKDIHFLGDQELDEALRTIESTPVATYRYKTAEAGSKVNYGVIAEHTPTALLSDDDKAVNLSNTIGMLMAAVKAQQKEIANLQAEVRELRDGRGPVSPH